MPWVGAMVARMQCRRSVAVCVCSMQGVCIGCGGLQGVGAGVGIVEGEGEVAARSVDAHVMTAGMVKKGGMVRGACVRQW